MSLSWFPLPALALMECSEGSTASLRTWNDDLRLFPEFCQDTLQAGDLLEPSRIKPLAVQRDAGSHAASPQL